MPRKGHATREMEKRLKRAGVHPHDIKIAADFINRAKRRDKRIEKEIEKNGKNEN